MPLTQALASQAEGRGLAAVPPAPPPSLYNHLPRTWDEVSAGHGEPLGATFLFLVRELADLTAQLQTNGNPAPANHHIFLPPQVPGPRSLVHALLEAREKLRDLKGLLSRP